MGFEVSQVVILEGGYKCNCNVPHGECVEFLGTCFDPGKAEVKTCKGSMIVSMSRLSE